MKVDNRISPQIIAGAVGLLQPFIPELLPQDLIEAIRNHNGDLAKAPKVKQTLTIRQTADILQISTMSVQRMLKAEQLPRIRVGKRSVRIPVDAINKILENGRNKCNY